MTLSLLTPIDGRKSFYGKAIVIEKNGNIVLKSYDTYVAVITPDGVFHRTWDDWSSTTGRHVKAFAYWYHRGWKPNKSDWDSLQVEDFDDLQTGV